MSETMKALKIISRNHAAIVPNAPKPSVRATYILVKTNAVALNPTDYKHIGFVEPQSPDKQPTVGCDYSGTVVEVGPQVTLPWTAGDRVCGVVHGSNETQPQDGAFGEWLLAKGDLQIRVPVGWSDEEAAGIGMGVSTVGQGMYQALGLPWKWEQGVGMGGEKMAVFIYGGSTAMGAYGIQFAKCSGLDVYTVCSRRNFAYVKTLGADHIYDYNDPGVGDKIRSDSNNSIFQAWDTIGQANSAQICADALSSNEQSPVTGERPKYCCTLFTKCPRSDVSSLRTIMYTTFGEAFVKSGKQVSAKPEDFEFMKKFVANAQTLIDRGGIRPHTVELREGGLDGILAGLEDMEKGKVSGKKLVYKL